MSEFALISIGILGGSILKPAINKAGARTGWNGDYRQEVVNPGGDGRMDLNGLKEHVLLGGDIEGC